jgi:hypothetical protein
LAASDNLKENYTTVVIHVKDVNDNPPVFERPTYRTQITEEDDRNLPKRVLQVQIQLFSSHFFPHFRFAVSFFLFVSIFASSHSSRSARVCVGESLQRAQLALFPPNAALFVFLI